MRDAVLTFHRSFEDSLYLWNTSFPKTFGIIMMMMIIIIILDIDIQEAHSVDAAILSSHNLHSNVTEKLQNCADLKEELLRM